MKFGKISIILLAAAIGLPTISVEAKSYKRGVSENVFQYHAQMQAIEEGVTWFYNWGNTLGNYIFDQEYMEFCPMVWSGNYNADNIRKYAKSHPNCKYLLAFNEPNFKSQANMTPALAAERWPAVKALADELGLKIVAPALNYSPDAPYNNPTTWMDEFVRLVGNDAFDFTAIHFYGGFGGMKDLCTQFHNRYGKPVWVTEFCYWPGEMGDVTASAQLSSMVESVEWLEKTDWIYRYAWFKALEDNRANFKLIESGKGEDPRELTELGYVYVHMSDYDASVFHKVDEVVPASEYINRQFAGLGKGNNPDNPKPIEVVNFNSGATIDYQFDVPESGNYNLVLTVTGVGEPTRFDPKLSVTAVKANGTEGSELSPAQQFELPGNETDYKNVIYPLVLTAGKQTIRIKDVNTYAPSGLRISTLRLADAAGVGDIAVDSESKTVDVVNLQGVVIRRNVEPYRATDNLPAGMYIIGGQKVIVR